MGKRGTEVARAAASLVLLDDSFTTIERSIEDGRRIFDNLRAAFVYLIAFHVPLVLLGLVIPAAGAPLLLLPSTSCGSSSSSIRRPLSCSRHGPPRAT